jgi:beta-glucosidase
LPLTPIAIGAKTKIYFESYFQKRGASSSNVYQTTENKYDVEFVKTPEEADVVLMWITPVPSLI